jgi:hypothetical protein
MTFRDIARWTAFVLCGGVALAYRPSARGAVPEAELKSVLLFHLSQFVSWPPPGESQPFKIGVLGPDELGEDLDQAVRGEQIHGRSIAVVRSAQAADLVDCQIVFVSSRARETLPHIAQTLKGMPALLVGDSDDFLDKGGMVNFALRPNHKIQLEVQLDRLRASGLNMSAQLLRISVVKGAQS